MPQIVLLLLVLLISGCMDSANRISRAAAHQALVDMLQTEDGQTKLSPRAAELLLRELRQDGATLIDLSGNDFMDAACRDLTKNEG